MSGNKVSKRFEEPSEDTSETNSSNLAECWPARITQGDAFTMQRIVFAKDHPLWGKHISMLGVF